MADVRAVYAVGHSLVTWLSHAFEASAWPGGTKPRCSFQLVGGKAFVGTPTLPQGVLFFLYRVVWNEHARSQAQRPGSDGRRPPLGLDLHYLAIPWADDAQTEQVLLAWTMRALENRPTLGPGDLTDGGFREDESVQIVPVELNHEDLMRIWDALDPPFRVSVPYAARVVRLDLDAEPEYPPVVARKLSFESMPSGERGRR
ncbi:DUF4255 domain-containing protein [Sorangium sp. So ce1389]|uniref:DUF4255 domain-containing protein n=1 Tax=Sorangium sp. So ce1389 TaxID=3133336 RepID=UPI003F62AFB4